MQVHLPPEEIVISQVRQELSHQQNLKNLGKFPFTAGELASRLEFGDAMNVLMEEVGECSKECNEFDGSKIKLERLRKEMIQVAAVAISFASGINIDGTSNSDY